jgi:hypothetical protein
MNLIALFVTVNVLIGGSQPEYYVLPTNVMPMDQCERLVQVRSSMPFTPGVDSRGRMIMHKSYQCLTIHPMDIEKAVELLEANKR